MPDGQMSTSNGSSSRGQTGSSVVPTSTAVQCLRLRPRATDPRADTWSAKPIGPRGLPHDSHHIVV
jgi:hypothetical protein